MTNAIALSRHVMIQSGSMPKQSRKQAMDNIDALVLKALRDWHSAGQGSLLATVVRTWGSSPRPVESMMASREDGRAIDYSVSEGCIEDDLIACHIKVLNQSLSIPDAPPKLVRYGVSADDAHRLGLPCGGTLELLLEFTPDAASLQKLVAQLESGSLVKRSVDCSSGEVTLQTAKQPAALEFDAHTPHQPSQPRLPHAADRCRCPVRISGHHGLAQ